MSNVNRKWREHFRGGFGNPGEMSESAWNRGGLGAGYFDEEQPIPVSDIPPPRRERGGFYQGRWSERGYGPRHYAGGFIGHEYSWKRRDQGPKHPRGVPGAGPYAGRGPRGYQRSEERVRDDVCELLTEHGAIDASEIDVRVHKGEVTLEGTVEDRRSKRLAEDIADSIRGVHDVHNHLRVSKPG